MAYASPQANDYQNSPSHSKGHRVYDYDTAAPDQSVCVAADGKVGVNTNAPTKDFEVNGNIKADNLTVGGATIDALVATTDLDIGSHKMKAVTFESDVATGTAPLTVASTTKVTNLNADRVDGYHVSAYSGGESYTLLGGLIMKMGYVASGGSGGTVTFASAFPNGVVSINITPKHYTHPANPPTIIDFTKSDFDWADDDATGVYWQAIGY